MALFYPHYYYHLPKLINLLVLSFWVTSLGPLMVNIAGNISVFMIPKCVARVPVSLRGSGVEGVFAGRCVHDRNRSHPSATVRVRHFWRFPASRCFVSRGRRGTSWHSDMFRNVWKIVLCRKRNTFAMFWEDALHFSWQTQHFGGVCLHFVWQAQHFRRVLWLVFCKSHCQGCVKWWQGANSVAGVAFCEMCWKLTEASHETSILRLQIFRV